MTYVVRCQACAGQGEVFGADGPTVCPTCCGEQTVVATPSLFCVDCANYTDTFGKNICKRGKKVSVHLSPIHGPQEDCSYEFFGDALKERLEGACGMDAVFYVKKESEK